MPWIHLLDDLDTCPQRVLVAGPSGSGKSTLARRIASAIDGEYVDLDALAIGEGWTARASFVDDVRQFAAQPAWATEWGYVRARPILAERADLVVLLDLPRWLVMTRLIRRTVRQRRTRTVLWNGNVQPPLWRVLVDRNHVIRWTWRTLGEPGEHADRLLEQRPELPMVRLRSRREIQAWVDGQVTRASRIAISD